MEFDKRVLNTIWFSLGARVISDLPESVNQLLHQHLGGIGKGIEKDGRTLRITVGPVADSREGLQARPIDTDSEALSIYYRENTFWVPGLFRAVIEERRTDISVCTNCVKQIENYLELFSLAFTEAHRAGGWLPLHAAAVARDDWAVAISGASGAGKSTATLRLYNQGYQVISEDRTFWQIDSGRVAGLDRYLRVFDDSAARFPLACAGEFVGRDANGKGLLPLQPFYHAKVLDRLFIFSPQEEITPPQRIRAVWEMSGVPLTSHARKHAQRGVTKLLPLIHPIGITRESVMNEVAAALQKCP